MTIQMKCQNIRTGDAYEVSELVTAARWTTKRSGAPAALTLTLRTDPAVVWDHGSIIAVLDGGRGIFYGYVFKLSQSEAGEVEVTAYDQTRYLKNKDTYVFQGKRADEIAARIAADFKMNTGKLADTGYVIPSMVEDNKGLFDIILKALDLTLIHTGRMFYLWDDFGALRVSEVKPEAARLVVGDGSLATGFSYASDIDSETYNKIKLVRDNKETGKRDVYLIEDSNSMNFWGVLQHFEKVDAEMNEGQIRALGGQMLELYNRPKRTFQVSALGDLTVRAGAVVLVSIKALGIEQPFLVEEAAHDLLKETMDLKLKAV